MRKRKIIIGVTLGVLLIFILFGYLFIHKIIKINTPSIIQYPVRGVDVSSYQGKIDWEVLSKQDIEFAYIKATEGSSYVDKQFSYNYKKAIKTGVYVGAYHFFSYDSSGSTQAANFIQTVPKNNKMLPPVVDVEFYGNKEKHPPKKEDVRENLTILLDKLEAFMERNRLYMRLKNRISYIYQAIMSIMIYGLEMYILSLHCQIKKIGHSGNIPTKDI